MMDFGSITSERSRRANVSCFVNVNVDLLELTGSLAGSRSILSNRWIR